LQFVTQQQWRIVTQPTDTALKDVRVLDLTRFLSGPHATLLLAGLGAEVIRVDDPKHGDPTFSAPPFLGPDGISLQRKSAEDIGLAYLKRGRSKKAVSLDLKHPEGRELFLRLIEKADVVVENFRPGVLQRLNLEYATLKAANSGIIHCSISGYGATGPMARRKSYDLMVQAAAGLMSITGEPSGAPYKAGSPISDSIAGTFAVVGVLAALLQRGRTGEGQFIDVSMVDCLFSLLFDEPLDCYETLGLPPRQGNRIMRFSPFNAYATRNGAITVGAATKDDWVALLYVIGREDLLNDANYMDWSWRVANNEQVDALVLAWTRTQTSEQALTKLDERDIACSPINAISDLMRWGHLLSRGMLQPILHPGSGAGSAMGSGFPLKFSGANVGYHAPAAMPSANNLDVYRGLLGLSQADLSKLKLAGVI
jgi:crotonobetainyl-CoA:carnitine CoA-transferase CaiB-like acyl-CoA transferase